jgi:hypothetical protein
MRCHDKTGSVRRRTRGASLSALVVVATLIGAAITLSSSRAQVSLAKVTGGPPRAMWLWNPSPLLADATARHDFIEFCRREHVERVWMQVGTTDRPAARGHAPIVTLDHAEGWRGLIAEAHEAGLKIEALDGSPRYALKTNHGAALSVVDAIMAYNRSSPPGSRFDGFHFDNEPYLLRAWHFPVARESLLREFLELNAGAQQRVHTQPGMEYGIDIPFWWQSIDDRTGRPTADVLWRGKRLAASYHCIELLDNVGIMNYRNRAEGSDGMIAHGSALLDYADRARHAKLYMGVETSEPTPTRVWFAVGVPNDIFNRLAEREFGTTEGPARYQGFKVHTFDDEANTHIGLEVPEDGSRGPELQAGVAAPAKLFGVSVSPELLPKADAMRAAAFAALRETGEWRDMKARPIPGGEGIVYPGFEATGITLAKLTFANVPLATMRQELEKAETAFLKHPSYAGLAIHHYVTFRVMMREAPARTPASTAELSHPIR